ncbi:hypothetical protein BDV93DRAFT_43465 [Ceratobasidium sp. AG-I]|nr:hypothetical protein BDV93DRAFT_43465 [Ceratobasidium sp. AG-I]
MPQIPHGSLVRLYPHAVIYLIIPRIPHSLSNERMTKRTLGDLSFQQLSSHFLRRALLDNPNPRPQS